MIDNKAADIKAKEIQKELDLKKTILKEDLKKILKTPYGRRFIWDLMRNKCIIHRVIYPNEQQNISYLEGQKSIGLSLLARIEELEPCYLVQMASEEASARNAKRNAIKRIKK